MRRVIVFVFVLVFLPMGRVQALSQIVEEIYGTPDAQVSGVASFASPMAEELEGPEHSDDLVAEPIDIVRPRGSALLLTADEVRDALTRPVRTRGHLEKYAKALVQTDAHVRRIEIGESGVRMLYEHGAKLFGFLPLSYVLETTIDARGRLHIRKSWWLFLAEDGAGDIKQQLRGRVIEKRLILGNLLKIPDLRERKRAIVEMLAALTRNAYEVHSAVLGY